MAIEAAIDPVCVPSAYDGLGWFYDRYWRNVCDKLMPALDRLLLSELPRRTRVLDLCCGTGRLSAAMLRRGLDVTGLDGSPDMIRFAGQNAPGAQFVVADARGFDLPGPFDAVVSTGDSMNHMLTLQDLGAVFRCVSRTLAPGGVFVFDLNMAQAFASEWHKTSTLVGPDHLLYVRGRFNKSDRIGVTEVTVFTDTGNWTRLDFMLFQRCYYRREVKAALIAAGFADVSVHPARSLGVRGRLAVGRSFFRARMPDALPCE